MRFARIVFSIPLWLWCGSAWAQPAPVVASAPAAATSAAATDAPKDRLSESASGADEKAEGYTIENSLSIRDPFRRPLPSA